MAGVLTERTIDIGTLPGVMDAMSANGQPRSLTFTKSLRETSVFLGSEGKKCFDAGRSPDGSTWAPLKRQRNRLRDRRAAKKHPEKRQKVLRDTGLLMASMSASAAHKTRGSVVELTKISLIQGTNISYAPFHQFGTRHIPARPFAGINEKAVQRIENFVADDVVRQILGA